MPENDAIKQLSRRLETLTIEWADTAALKPNPWNPNRQNEHEFQMLVNSIEDAGFTQPIMVAEITEEARVEWQSELESGYQIGDLVIVDGEHRWRAAMSLDVDPVPIVVMPYGAVQARLSTLQMNRARGTEDIVLATEVLRDLEKLGVLDWVGDRLNMSDDELAGLLDNIPEPDIMPPPAPGEVVPDVASTTPAALVADRQHEARLKAAKTAEERAMRAVEGTTFRLVLTFAGDEATVVRQALGSEPALKVLAWCKARAGGVVV